MKTRQLMYTGMLAVALTCFSISAQALDGGALANGFIADSSRDDTNNGLGYALDAVHFLDNYQGVTLRVSYANLETDLLIENDFQRYTGTLGYWRYLDGDSLRLRGFRPYLNAGVGFGRQRTVTSKANSDSGLLVEAATGLVSTWNVLIPNLKFRPELRLDYEAVYSNAVDLTVGLGLHYVFGAPAPAPVMAEQAPTMASAYAKPVPAAAPSKTAKAASAPAPARDASRMDSDGDGVKAKDDDCLARGGAADKRACRQIKKAVAMGFDSDSATLKPTTFGTLRDVAAALKANPKLKVEVGGHCSSAGDEKLNQVLSEKRAQAGKNFLIKEGVAGDRITMKGFGESQHVDTNDTSQGRAKNRRIELEVLN